MCNKKVYYYISRIEEIFLQMLCGEIIPNTIFIGINVCSHLITKLTHLLNKLVTKCSKYTTKTNKEGIKLEPCLAAGNQRRSAITRGFV